MSNTIIVGAQWGDEGKGKVVDFLTSSADVVVRAQGGNNAGHTVICEGKKYILHLLPSGILWPGKTCVIGNGVALDPIGLVTEIETLERQGIAVRPEQLLISDRAHLTLPYHREIDGLREQSRGDQKIGTTRRGIGPTYADKANRTGFRMADTLDRERFLLALRERIAESNDLLTAAGMAPVDPGIVESVLAALDRLRPHITNTMAFLHGAITEGRTLLFEGAQGTFLDIDHGTYPFVTSSNTTAGGACTGSGVPPNRIDRVIAVAKAYTTRVGTGPFPTENQDLGDHFHAMGREFGATTGRERRCGWLDLVLLRHSVMINGVDSLAITNLDGLDQIDPIRICTHYELDGHRLELPPSTIAELERVVPVYETLPAWNTDISACRSWEDLPEAARRYIHRIESLLRVPVGLVSVGPDRNQTLLRDPRWTGLENPSIRVRPEELPAIA
jgi:adenylosuccinate synthase